MSPYIPVCLSSDERALTLHLKYPIKRGDGHSGTKPSPRERRGGEGPPPVARGSVGKLIGSKINLIMQSKTKNLDLLIDNIYDIRTNLN